MLRAAQVNGEPEETLALPSRVRPVALADIGPAEDTDPKRFP
jgi:hypothetical protein